MSYNQLYNYVRVHLKILLDMFKKERPGIEQVDLVHHEDDYTEVTCFASTLKVAQEERMAQHMTSVVVAKEHRPLLSGTHLKYARNIRKGI